MISFKFPTLSTPFPLLKKEKDHILYTFSPGKPNPHEMWNENNDPRTRIYQKGAPQGASFDYACHLLRPRIGNVFPEEWADAHKIEKIFSDLRKRILALPHDPELIFLIKNSHNRTIFQNITHKKKEGLETLKTLSGKVFEEFMAQEKHKNLLDFLLEKVFQPKIDLLEEFLLKISEKDTLPLIKSSAETSAKKSELPINFIYLSSLESFLESSKIHLFNLNLSIWSPKKGIHGLVSQLKEHGPMAVKGVFGRNVYTEDPFIIREKIADQDIYAWKKGLLIKRDALQTTIVVVGAKAETKKSGRVYFVDPSDPSNPYNPSTRKIYLISFERFCANLYNLHTQGSEGPPQYGFHAQKIKKPSLTLVLVPTKNNPTGYQLELKKIEGNDKKTT